MSDATADAAVFLPSDDIFSEVFLSSCPTTTNVAVRYPLHLPPDDLAFLISDPTTTATASADAEIARKLAAALTLTLTRASADVPQPRGDPHSFFEFGPAVQPPPPGPAPHLDQGYFWNLAASRQHHHVDGRRPVGGIQMPAKPVRVQAEESGFPAMARAQGRPGPGRVGWTGFRDYGGTGVFLPRIVENGTGKKRSGMQGGVREKQKHQPVRGRQAMPHQHPSERGLPQDWSY